MSKHALKSGANVVPRSLVDSNRCEHGHVTGTQRGGLRVTSAKLVGSKCDVRRNGKTYAIPRLVFRTEGRSEDYPAVLSTSAESLITWPLVCAA